MQTIFLMSTHYCLLHQASLRNYSATLNMKPGKSVFSVSSFCKWITFYQRVSLLFNYPSHVFSTVFLHPAAEEHNQKKLLQLRFVTWYQTSQKKGAYWLRSNLVIFASRQGIFLCRGSEKAHFLLSSQNTTNQFPQRVSRLVNSSVSNADSHSLLTHILLLLSQSYFDNLCFFLTST